MADVTISQLDPGTPSSTDVLPFSIGNATRKVQAQSIPVAWASVTGKPSIGTNASGDRTISTLGPSGGSDGDIHYQY